MRVVLYVFGSRGDAHPMIALGQELLRDGHDVLLCSPPDFERDAVGRGLGFHPIGTSASALLQGGVGKVDVTGEVVAQFTGLYEAARDSDLIVGAGVPLAGPGVAEKTGARFRYVAYCPEAFPCASHAPMLWPYKSQPRLMNRATWAVLGELWWAYVDKANQAGRAAIGLAPRRRHDYVSGGDGPDLLAADELLAPAPADVRVPVAQVPAIQLTPSNELSEHVEAFLAAGDPPVYLGFGSMPSSTPERHAKVVRELAAKGGRRFIVSWGWSGIDAGLPEGSLLIGDEPHDRLFGRCAAVVHHGGAGTTHTALRAGVPQVIVPCAADQPYWAKRVMELGVGERCGSIRSLSAQRLDKALDRLLGDAAMASRVRDAAAAVGRPDSAAVAATLLL
jgi:vancomycin aglycone glucosyltransferase